MINWKDNIQPEPPFIASIFHYYLADNIDGYEEYDDLTLELAKNSPGYLGYESFKHDGRGSFISYWKDMDSVCLLYTSPSPRDATLSRMPSSA